MFGWFKRKKQVRSSLPPMRMVAPPASPPPPPKFMTTCPTAPPAPASDGGLDIISGYIVGSMIADAMNPHSDEPVKHDEPATPAADVDYGSSSSDYSSSDYGGNDSGSGFADSSCGDW